MASGGPPVEGPRGPLVPGRPGLAAKALGLVRGLLAGLEWGDAVTSLASLDLDPEEAAAPVAAAALGAALAGPPRRAAALLLQGRSSTERPDAAARALASALLAGAAAGALASVPLDRGLAVAGVPDGIALCGAASGSQLALLGAWMVASLLIAARAFRFGDVR